MKPKFRAIALILSLAATTTYAPDNTTAAENANPLLTAGQDYLRRN